MRLRSLVSRIAGSQIRLIVYGVVALVALGLVGWGAWSLYDYGGLREQLDSLGVQQEQNQDLERALVEDREAEERDREQLERAEQAAEATADLDEPGPRWLGRWLDCVHVHADRGLPVCARDADNGAGAGMAGDGPERDPPRATDGAGQDGT